MSELVSPTGRRTIVNALLTLPQSWDHQAPVQVRAAALDVAMTVAPEGLHPLLAAHHCQRRFESRVTLHTDETGLRIVEASSTPADQLEPHAYLLEAYHVAPQWCDAAAQRAGVPSWADLVHGLVPAHEGPRPPPRPVRHPPQLRRPLPLRPARRRPR